MKEFYPLCFRPVYKDYLWGGRRIINQFKRSNVPGKVAESWEISDRDEGMSIILNGKYQGLTLHDLLELFGSDLVGKTECSKFPFLIKLIDAEENLSVQVHPKAKSIEAEPKEEIWYILNTKEKSGVLAGFSKDITEEEYLKAIDENTLLSLVNHVPVRAGDVISVPGGRIHAILAGCLLLEIQQNSDTTYRIYDWERQRELHLEKALNVIDLHKTVDSRVSSKIMQQEKGAMIEEFSSTPHFQIQKISPYFECFNYHESFQIFFTTEKKLELTANKTTLQMEPGRCYLTPAACDHVYVKGGSFLRITL